MSPLGPTGLLVSDFDPPGSYRQRARSLILERPWGYLPQPFCHPAGLDDRPLPSILVILRRSRHTRFGCGGSVFAARTFLSPGDVDDDGYKWR